MKDTLKISAILDHTWTKENKEEFNMTLPFPPSGWYFIGLILDWIPLWGSNDLYRQKCAFAFYNKKTEGRWDVWIVGMKSLAQFQAPWINLGTHFHHEEKASDNKTDKVTSQERWRKWHRRISLQIHFGLVPREGPQYFWRVPRDCPQSILLPPSFPFSSPFLTNLHRTNSLWNDFFFLIIRAKWAMLER